MCTWYQSYADEAIKSSWSLRFLFWAFFATAYAQLQRSLSLLHCTCRMDKDTYIHVSIIQLTLASDVPSKRLSSLWGFTLEKDTESRYTCKHSCRHTWSTLEVGIQFWQFMIKFMSSIYSQAHLIIVRSLGGDRFFSLAPCWLTSSTEVESHMLMNNLGSRCSKMSE